MNKRGFVLAFSLLASLILSLILSGFYVQNINENKQARISADSARAFWLAEAGVATAYVSFPTGASGNLPASDPNSSYNATVSLISGNYYRINSTGSITHSDGSVVSQAVSATVRGGVVDPSKFQFGIETTTDLVVKGSVDINPSDSWKENSTLDFANLFNISKAEMKAGATHLYTSATFAAPVDGITWVDVTPTTTLTISGNLVGSGVLVINGDVHFSGTVVFDGIIYVIGTLKMTGTVTTTGAVLAESSTTVDTTILGNVTINYDVTKITDALGNVVTLNKQLVSWQIN